MNKTVRIGAAIGPHDPFWVQVRETVFKRIEQLNGALIPLDISGSNETLFSLDPASLAEEVLAQDLDAVVCQTLPIDTIYQLVENGLPVIFLGESQITHPLFCSPTGLYQAGKMAAEYIAAKIGGRGTVLCAGGLLDLGDDKGVSRMNGFYDYLRSYPDITLLYCPTAWRYDQAYQPIYTMLGGLERPVDAIYGLSDSIALASRDAARALGMVTPQTIIVGTNGDPLALAGIMEGTFSATVETSSEDLGISAVEIAFGAARGVRPPPHYAYRMQMITADNVIECAARKMAEIATLPGRLVGVNREEERYRLVQMETGSALNRHVGSLLNHSKLIDAVAELLRANYGFDSVQYYRWSAAEGKLSLDQPEPSSRSDSILLKDMDTLLAEAIRRNDIIYIPDIRYSNRFVPDPKWPDTRSRVVLPVRLGDEIIGLLDLHSMRPVYNLRWDLISLQALADQFAIALRNADLYNQALKSREAAERADQLKTRLLANISHELRTPLNVILGYSQAALNSPNPYGTPLPEGLLHDIGYIYQSGEHLIRIINDLLDLSRAEIGELNVFPEPVDTRRFLEEVFNSISNMDRQEPHAINWILNLPHRLPIIQADPVRLRQILLNLFSNAIKYTPTGQITLGAVVEPPYLHIWVADTGEGIPVEQQEKIFEPFVTSRSSMRRREGIGLGLSITRRLVALHGGSMSLESQMGQGSTFHVYWPLPSLSGEIVTPGEPGSRPALVMLSAREFSDVRDIPEEIRAVAAHRNLEICPVHSIHLLEERLHEVQPVALAWDMYNALPGEWNIIQRLCSHPNLAGLPLILFGYDSCTSGIGVTNVFLKPFAGKKLSELIESLRPQDGEGTVLIADDDPQAAAMYCAIVKESLPGCSTVVAANGQEALDYLRDNQPAIVILDLLMPKVNGFEVLEKLRVDPRTCRTPVIVLSGKMLTFEDVSRLNYPNVVFHSKGMLTPEEIAFALQKTVSSDIKVGQPTSRLVKQALAFLHQNYERAISRSELAETVGVSDNYLTQIFHQELGLSPVDCLNRLRILKARELLDTSDLSISMIAVKVGFDDPAYFSRVFRRLTGKSPNGYRMQK